VCNLRMAFVRQSQIDVPASQIFVYELNVFSPAPVARDMLRAFARTVRHAEFTRLSDEQYELQHRGAARPANAGVQWIPQDARVPSGCAAYVQKTKVIGPAGAPDALTLVSGVAARAPDQPVQLVVRFATGTPVRGVARLVTPYAISRLSLTARAQTSPISSSGLFYLDFSAGGASPEAQLEKAECQLHVAMRDTEPSITLIDRKFQLIFQATADMKAKDAARLIKSPPDGAGVGFARLLPADALEASQEAFISAFKEPIPAAGPGTLMERCARYGPRR
jgi:hypothetical protein